MPDDDVVKRLERFEEKLDKVADALFQLARVEERQTHTTKTLERIWAAMEAHDNRISQVERRQGITLTSQAMWAVIALLVGVIGWMFQG